MKPKVDVEDPDVALVDLWPGHMPEGEKTAWDRLPLDKKKQAVMRLSAIAARASSPAAPGTKKVSAQQAADMAQVAVPTFYSIEKRWRTSPSIGSLGINAPPEENRRPESDAKQQARNLLRRVLRKDPDLSVPALHDLARGELGEACPSFGTILRLTRDLRGYYPATGTFARRIIFDSAGLDLVDEAGRRLRLCVVLDNGTGLLLGWDLAPDDSLLLGYRSAALHASMGLRYKADKVDFYDGTGLRDIDFSGGVSNWSMPEEIELRVLPKDVMLQLDWPLDRSALHVLGVPKLGSRIMDILGERVGGLWLGVGVRDGTEVSYRTGRPVSMPVANRTTFAMVGSDIVQHNQRVLEAQKSRGGNPVPDGVVDQLKANIRALSQTILERQRRA